MPNMKPPKQIRPSSLNDYLEVMSKAVFQTGMSWRVVESKWPQIREALQNFDVEEVAAFDDHDLRRLVEDKRVIRNFRKLSAIVSNAKKMAALESDHRTFTSYLRSHGDFDETVKAMKRDFKFMGPTACYYFLYVVGEKVPPHHEFEAAYRK
jgi:DNA-3-methyladenine glycosylase I